LSFGPNRTLTFPHSYFCSECKASETDKHSNHFGRGKRAGKRYKCTANHTEVDNPSEVGCRQLSYYASTYVARSNVARGRRGRSPPSEITSVPVAKKKFGLGATIDGLKLKISQLKASVYEAVTEVASKKCTLRHCKIPINCCKKSLVVRSSVLLMH
jgi:hypothetical protein